MAALNRRTEWMASKLEHAYRLPREAVETCFRDNEKLVDAFLEKVTDTPHQHHPHHHLTPQSPRQHVLHRASTKQNAHQYKYI